MRNRRAVTLLEIVVASVLTLTLVTALVEWSQVIQKMASAGTARVDASRTATLVSVRLATDFDNASGCDQLRRGRSIATISSSELVLLGDVTGDLLADRVSWAITGDRIVRTVEPGEGGCSFAPASAPSVVTDKVKTSAAAHFSVVSDGSLSAVAGVIDCVLQPASCSFDSVVIDVTFEGEQGSSLRYVDSFPVDSKAFTVAGQQSATGAGAGFSPPGAPSSVTVAGGPGLVLVSWHSPASTGGAPIESYEVQVTSANQNTPSGVTGALVRSTSVPPFTFTGLTYGTSYSFQVRATTAAGTGPWSAPSAASGPTAASITTGITGLAPIAAPVGTQIAATGVPTGGQGPYAWSVSPALSFGLSLSASTGVLSGQLGAGVVAVAGSSTPCVLLAGGAVACWGQNNAGQLGQGDTTNRGTLPAQLGSALPRVDLGTGKLAKALAAGSAHTCVVRTDGKVVCWGSNSAGQLGQGDTNNRGDNSGEMGSALAPVNLGTGRTALAVAAGDRHTCALLDNGSVKCWGLNDFGQLGQGHTTTLGDNASEMGDNLPAVALGSGRSAIAIAAGGRVSCALLDNATLKCWGQNGAGQLGQGDTVARGDQANEMGDSLSPVNLGTNRSVTAVVLAPGTTSAAGSAHVCALLNNATVKCFGANAAGQLGQGDVNNRGDSQGEMGDALGAVQVGSGRSVIGLGASGGQSTCARLDNGSTVCWGSNSSGELGLGDIANRGDNPGEMGDSLPRVLLPSQVVSFASGGSSASQCALLANNRVVCWGANDAGQLGVGSVLSKGDGPLEMGTALSPVSLGTVTASYTITVQDVAGVSAQTSLTISAVS